jgi:hypothetical protein
LLLRTAGSAAKRNDLLYRSMRVPKKEDYSTN